MLHHIKKNKKVALITGITGQDGSFLAEILLSKNYEVHGLIRRASTFNTSRVEHLYTDPHDTKAKLFLHYGDLNDTGTIRQLIYSIQPNEIYNLGAQSHVRVSFDTPEYTADVTALGALRILEAIKDFQIHTKKKIKFYQASSSEMFGTTPPPQNENTVFHPQSPYGCSKVYREAYGIFAVNGILFNHESERRGETFVTRKITRGIARIKAGLDRKIFLGNLEAKRDWGYAPEYMEAAYLMMQYSVPDDYVVGTGESHSIHEFLEIAFKEAGLGDYKKYVVIDPRYYRPAEVHNLIADTAKVKKVLGWKPKTNFIQLVKIMVGADIKNLKNVK
ncbi:MAG: GDP-mannose 4,6-dehydratase [Candidatus Jorgensenbacteria bacterium GW2011_GWF2_41_8]|uniref:GDP-mannose 4,6-dehydratase n=1 Tax=Candidatus Jorgensenbacteria bacterium GW2011_GWF2_41_8 TaxID=1618667 RepID=A0A0G0XKK2_9BACT|nr:MAG: GDP-mannose 4,6-dehydratase [Candidatus Jorgensenbacteria bacterium GW2011_GWF2_41_8]